MYGLGLAISAELEAALKAEARRYAESITGQLYELIPESVRRTIESQYIERRARELGAQVKPFAARIGPAAIAIAGGLLVFLLLGRR